MDASATLTWYSGSVLPFASLWHTLHRLMSLNAMRGRELQAMLGGSCQKPSVRMIDLLCNESAISSVPEPVGAVDIQRLARALGEPAHVFQWSHFGRLPNALRGVATVGLRLCPVCAALGYHSALFSIRALDRCPIHRCAFIAQCRCGQPFQPVIRLREAAYPGQCRCGQVAYFTKETCRRPTMSPDDLRPLQPVAAWMEELCTVTRPWGHPRHAQQLHDGLFVESLGAWSHQLGLNGPPHGTCAPPEEQFSIDVIERKTLQPRQKVTSFQASQPEPACPQHARGGLWEHSEATVAYRALLRHIRRHVGRHSDRFAQGFLEHPDPLAMAQQMRSDPQAMVAYAELLFCVSMERFAMKRRWPYRQFAHPTQWPVQDKLVDPWFSAETGPERPLAPEERGWLARQAAARSVSHAWRRAQRCAMASIRNGIADWSCATEQFNGWPGATGGLVETWGWHSAPPPYQVTWAASISADRLRFVSYPASQRIDWDLPPSNKLKRREAWRAAQRGRVGKVSALLRVPCLRWTARDGWEARTESLEASTSVVRHSLFLPHGQRTQVLLYPLHDGFIMRATDEPIEVCSTTPREAFAAMRTAVAMYRARYGVPVAGKTPRARRLERPDLCRSDLNSAYKAHLMQIFFASGFWRGAGMYVMRAHAHLDTGLRIDAAQRETVILEI
jgi:hypothetical protein